MNTSLMMPLIMFGFTVVVFSALAIRYRSAKRAKQISTGTSQQSYLLAQPSSPPVPYYSRLATPLSDYSLEFTLPSKPRVVMGSTYLIDGRHSHLASYRKGREGEDRIVERICDVLDDSWTVFRNLLLPGYDSDIDIVLVGPCGIWALEVKAYSGNFQVRKGSWHKETNNGHFARDKYGPNAQVRKNAARLCKYLQQNDVTSGNWVEPTVILAEDVNLDVESSGTEIWKLCELERKLTDIKGPTGHRRPNVNYARIISVLESAATAVYN